MWQASKILILDAILDVPKLSEVRQPTMGFLSGREDYSILIGSFDLGWKEWVYSQVTSQSSDLERKRRLDGVQKR